LKKVLGLSPPKLQTIDAKLQVTQEAEMDNIRRVVHDDPALDYGLQIEFHLADEDLRKRNLLHYALFHSITGLPLRQIVIYGGKSDPRHIIHNHLLIQSLELRFEILVLKQIPKELFIYSDVPEEVVLAILCDFGEGQPELVVRQILQHLHKICRNSNRIKKYQKQLLILSRLRKMEIIVKSQVEAMTIHYDIETDGLYLQGLEEGREEGAELKEREVIKNLWLLQEFPLEKIALLSSTSLERVIEILSAHLEAEGLSEAVAAQTLEAYQAKFV
jgi:hypothetical protein